MEGLTAAVILSKIKVAVNKTGLWLKDDENDETTAVMQKDI